jgi:hypothetical protein
MRRAVQLVALTSIIVLAATTTGVTQVGSQRKIAPRTYGVGNEACSAWLEAPANRRKELFEWALGFLSGVDFDSDLDREPTTEEKVDALLTRLCRTTPNSPLRAVVPMISASLLKK